VGFLISLQWQTIVPYTMAKAKRQIKTAAQILGNPVPSTKPKKLMDKELRKLAKGFTDNS
jgi:hypothetical protein